MNIEYKTTDCRDRQIGDPLDAIGSAGYRRNQKRSAFYVAPF
jgi:hypothetical protein